MKLDATVFYDVDTQRDFLLLDGKYHMPDAERVVPVLAALTDLARETGVKVVCSIDHHAPDDPLLQSNGGPYPDHCIVGTPGEKKIDETAPRNPLFLESKEYSSEEIQEILHHEGEIIFDRRQFESFVRNAHVRTVLRLLLQPIADIVIYGVYTEACVDRVITELIGLGPKLHVVKEAIASASADRADFLEKWSQQGVQIISFEELRIRIFN
ncbi:MAG: isochorismatase family protein [Candidatus Binatus sp.]|uniref:cysteine hydrolase family protein n=1 Tax=Candidatus Binatus sp. TaxID=2811406 RepID=UPI0027281ECA|nr:isochorismatase family protein [Candidatus Binatus sp.]MDO8434338.1 isochorismatase family protein [Candidatus Binatus sp.]